jgi:hypothetical protein
VALLPLPVQNSFILIIIIITTYWEQ